MNTLKYNESLTEGEANTNKMIVFRRISLLVAITALHQALIANRVGAAENLVSFTCLQEPVLTLLVLW